MTEHIVDVREGQNSDGFDRYPYDEMKKQSLSVIFEGEKRSKLIKISYDYVCPLVLWHLSYSVYKHKY